EVVRPEPDTLAEFGQAEGGQPGAQVGAFGGAASGGCDHDHLPVAVPHARVRPQGVVLAALAAEQAVTEAVAGVRAPQVAGGHHAAEGGPERGPADAEPLHQPSEVPRRQLRRMRAEQQAQDDRARGQGPRRQVAGLVRGVRPHGWVLYGAALLLHYCCNRRRSATLGPWRPHGRTNSSRGRPRSGAARAGARPGRPADTAAGRRPTTSPTSPAPRPPTTPPTTPPCWRGCGARARAGPRTTCGGWGCWRAALRCRSGATRPTATRPNCARTTGTDTASTRWTSTPAGTT